MAEPHSNSGGASSNATAEVLKQIKKYESEVGLAYEEIPPDLCEGQTLHLNAWSLIANDNTLVSIAVCTCNRVDKKAAEIMKSVDSGLKDTRVLSVREAAKARTREQANEVVGLEELCMNGAVGIGDVGMKALGEHCASTLRILHLSHATRVSDVGLRLVGMRAYRLLELNLSGCNAVDGVGIAAFGEAASNLVLLNLSGCSRLASWAFQRLVCGCRLLEDVDVSYCHRLEDLDLAVMATNCRRIRRLNLRDGKQFSDIGLVEVAKRCEALEWVDTSRSELPWKITDVGILGLAESCGMLKTLVAQGCDQLTDVAMSWLGRGCQALTHLDLKNCAKISNAGVRALSEGCYDLRYLDLTKMKGVTDTGVRALAANCAGLTHLFLGGMYMLTDGKKRDFGLEGLQALCGHAKNVEALHLVGCFQISKGALYSIAKGSFCEVLKDISLASCPNLDESAFVALVRKCRALEKVSLANCGECVTEKMIEQLGRNCRHLTHVDLTGSANGVAAPGIKALVLGCRKLVHFNLNGCVRVDDLCLAPFGDVGAAHFVPGLETLNLSGCPLIGDMGLAFLADGLSSCNVSLNLLGSKVASSGLMSVSERWKYSDIKKAPHFFGLYPMKRWKDRVVINSYAGSFKAANRLQRIFRGKKGREEARLVRAQFYRGWVVLRMQSWWRGRVAREYFQLLVWEFERRAHAHEMLVGFKMIIDAKERRRKLREFRELAIAAKAALQVQRVFRGHLAKLRCARLRAEREALFARQRSSAVAVQRVWRGHSGRNLYKALRAAKKAEEKRRDTACRRLQRVWRGAFARKQVGDSRRALADRITLEQKCASMLQARFRRHRCYKILWKASQQRIEFVRAAVKMQAAWRGRQARRNMEFMLMVMQQDAEEAAGLQLTCWARCLQAKQTFALKKQERANLVVKASEAAKLLQRRYRGYAARRDVARVKKNKAELVRKMIELENWSAVRLQSLWRGYSGRKRAALKMRQHKGQWKEMWDPDKRRPFYYNQVSGEIRWRKPQALLDLMRKPICHNCEAFEAVVECQNCIEFYCHSCWETVHYSGKRKRHKFRCLFDYYEQRVDYGDNEFPSRWPSEVEQDELVGWQLRVGSNYGGLGHDRVAEEVRGDWEKYTDDPDSDGIVEGTLFTAKPKDEKPRVFYYNVATAEGTYEEPPEWRMYLTDDDNDGSTLMYGGAGGNLSQPAQSVYEIADTLGGMGSPTSQGIGSIGAWSTMYDTEGGTEYYVNEETGETTYEMPLQLANSPHQGSSMVQAQSEWTKHFDDQFEVDYWFNNSTGEATYERPSDFIET
eukprot:CAMPEP_0114383778 /NCGR_PEP_ID=MMETSP0102-20121206/4948_1 /TAXON_ID=38822 ORGANISM="Pteridomonas danica, Strain PT" /NCGR_SAMPLE_ID=MMETSP0102 /ASSEMBLY_ACC=CAM_ASM_000212 /LENGTH=1302 /DNA_ID=CAMNT_0001539917 /DNA_START=24 /DNA_END=3932 /DNA_ORIENTATION=+